MADTLVRIAENYGPGLFMAVVVWIGYQKLVAKVIEVVESNTRAMQQLSERIAAVERKVE